MSQFYEGGENLLVQRVAGLVCRLLNRARVHVLPAHRHARWYCARPHASGTPLFRAKDQSSSPMSTEVIICLYWGCEVPRQHVQSGAKKT